MSLAQGNNYSATIIIFASKKSSAIYIRPLPTAGERVFMEMRCADCRFCS